jgi:hypothetical protein
MLVQVVSSVFDLMGTYHARWREVRNVEQVPLFGFPHGVGLEPVRVNVENMHAIFRQASRDLAEVWQHILSPRTLAQVTELGASADAASFADALWVEVVFDFALAYQRRALPREQLLRSLVPLYLGRTAAFVQGTADSGADEVEAHIRALADEFVARKPSLLERWP